MTQSDQPRDKPIDFLEHCRSLLFLPASNPRAIARARESNADAVILDLEDSVPPDQKEAARSAASEAIATEWAMPVGVRLNGQESEWYAGDIAAMIGSKAGFVVLPGVASADDVRGAASVTGLPVLAMIESAAGVLAATGIANVAAGLIAGTNDLAADLQIPSGAGREPLATALQLVVLAARSARIPAFDGVHNGLEDMEAFSAEAAQGRTFGFTGKSLIHPRQIAPCNRAFAPTEAELDRARRLVAAYRGGAERFEDTMIERMHLAAAERLIARS